MEVRRGLEMLGCTDLNEKVRFSEQEITRIQTQLNACRQNLTHGWGEQKMTDPSDIMRLRLLNFYVFVTLLTDTDSIYAVSRAAVKLVLTRGICDHGVFRFALVFSYCALLLTRMHPPLLDRPSSSSSFSPPPHTPTVSTRLVLP